MIPIMSNTVIISELFKCSSASLPSIIDGTDARNWSIDESFPDIDPSLDKWNSWYSFCWLKVTTAFVIVTAHINEMTEKVPVMIKSLDKKLKLSCKIMQIWNVTL
jgi:hypothetical protein